jgi:hypothetical protein
LPELKDAGHTGVPWQVLLSAGLGEDLPMSDKSVWATLSTIDCSAHVEKKGQFSYLSWTWAIAMVKEHYPLAKFDMEDDIVYPDGTMEVRATITIGEQSHTQWLPVLDFKNRAIQHPNAFDINSARMRCLVKGIAVGFGLGHYIYAGESTPQEPVIEETKEMIQAGAELNQCLENDDLHGAAQLWLEWGEEELRIIARAPSKGGQLTTSNRAKLKETAFRHAINEARGISMEGVA